MDVRESVRVERGDEVGVVRVETLGAAVVPHVHAELMRGRGGKGAERERARGWCRDARGDDATQTDGNEEWRRGGVGGWCGATGRTFLRKKFRV